MKDETVWLTQIQMSELFDRDIAVISRHIKNIFKEYELDEKSNLQKMQISTSYKPVNFYSLKKERCYLIFFFKSIYKL